MTTTLNLKAAAVDEDMPSSSRPAWSNARRKAESAWLRTPLALLVVIWPTVIVSALIRFFFHTDVFGFQPQLTDEVDYWHETATFIQTGFNGGYYTFNEFPSRIPFLHFGAHGPFFLVVEGAVGLLAGWYAYSGVVFNLVLVSLALAIFISVTRPNTWRLISLGVAVSCIWPLLLYLPTSMEEPFQDSVAIVVAAFFVVLLRRAQPAPRVATGLVIVLVLVSLVRPTWALLIIPAGLLGWRPRSWRARGLVVVASLAAVAGLTWVFSAAAAPPYPQGIALYTRLVDAVTAHGPFGVLDFAGAALRNLVTFATPNLKEDRLQIVQRMQVLFILLAYLGLGLVLLIRRRTRPAGGPPGDGAETLFQLWNLGSILAAIVTFNFVGDWVDWQVIAPQLILSMFLLIGLGRRTWLVAVFVLSSLVVARTFAHDFHEFRQPQYVYSQVALSQFHDSLRPFVVYDPHAGPWCNTLLLTENYPPELAEVAPGIGISIMLGNEMHLPPKSHYLLLDNATYERLKGQLHVRPLAATTKGVLYENLDSGCRPPQAQVPASSRRSA